ncbi:uncharacterized protein NECHADRAFT_88030 [Fusarium vanettenii 77-13-4]|uniref:Zn(2)-C6 fungal-type domain-containing protein n=1 Tax=Fusarium vanettenii (strain ATCC MYA-4622 / CBS 123669 / FGSC 9596 / NRRL 45880 / 77-13-4) TaxID=660122 RepID=C7ZPT6_FUSV7|nr:uncharacterized protein NECHADRAFT_88030 [Fusarium vanettenii 77-13-4]EEU33956.1 hypothetical protein NECHADRAFT_88030 [Fusarium vanettenii 77-13-4]
MRGSGNAWYYGDSRPEIRAAANDWHVAIPTSYEPEPAQRSRRYRDRGLKASSVRLPHLVPLRSGSKRYTRPWSSDDEARQKVRRPASQPPRASQACRSCAASKVRCDDLLTCRRCRKKGVSCVRPAHWREGETAEPHSSIESRAPETRLPGHGSSSSSRAHLLAPVSPSSVDSRLVGSTAPDANSNLLLITDNTQDQSLANSASMVNYGSPQSIIAVDPLLSLGEVPYMDGIFEFPFLTPHELSGLAGFYSGPSEQAVDSFFHSLDHHDSQQSPRGDRERADALTPASLTSNEATISSEAVKAYDHALGNWRPRPRDYLTQDIMSLSITPKEQTSMRGRMGYFDPTVIPDQIPSARRDEMVIVASHCFATSRSTQPIPCFPSVEILDELLKIFLTAQKDQPMSFIHIPHFSVSSCEISLLMACIAAGAASSPNLTAHRFGLALVEVLRRDLPTQAEQENTLTRTTPYVQALVIVSDVALWSGDKRKSEISDIQSAFATTRAMVRNTPSQVSCTEVSIPVPEKNQLWLARSAGEWTALYLGLQDPVHSQRSTLTGCLANGLVARPLPPQQDRELAMLLIAYSLLSMLVEDRRRIVAFKTDAELDLTCHILPGSSIARHIASLMDELRGEIDMDVPTPGSVATAFIFEFYNFNAASPNHLTEALLGSGRNIPACEALDRLKEWRKSRLARVAVWHAGQIFRVCRTTRPKDRSNFHIYALFHAALCLWTYGSVAAMASTDAVDTRNSEAVGNRPKIRVDGIETLRSQRWISHNHGMAYIPKSRDGIGAMDQATELAPIAPEHASEDSFMSPLLDVDGKSLSI